MGDATTLLFGLDGFRVVSVTRVHDDGDEHVEGGRRVVVEGVEDERACPDCGVLSGAVHDGGCARSRICRTAGGRCGCSGISGGGHAGSESVGGVRSARPALRSGQASG